MAHLGKGIRSGRIKRLAAVTIPVLLILAAMIFSLVAYYQTRSKEETDPYFGDTVEELERRQGEYDPQSIILHNTNPSEANRLAEQLNAKLRITDDGSFATLTLPEDTEILDVFKSGQYTNELTKMSADWEVRISDLNPEEEEESESSERLPARPRFDVPDSGYSKQTHLDYLNLADTWNHTKGEGITVAIIDTGIDTDHPEFQGRISSWSYNASEDKVVRDHNDWSLIEDEQGHGTKVAGVLAADLGSGEVVGVAPEVTLLVIKAECDQEGTFRRVSDLVFGLLYAIERDVQVVNMSFAAQTEKNPFAEATQLAVDSDIICVASAGNSQSVSGIYPAADPNVIGVGALAGNGWELADYSNYGDCIDLCAPGTVYTTVPGGEYGTASGTSFASPAVAGAVALYLSENSHTVVEYPDMLEVLHASSYDLGGKGNDWYYAYGALDISAAVLEEKGYITYDYMTDEIESDKQLFVRNHTRQGMSEPERLYAVFDGWYYDIECTDECDVLTDVFTADVTLYASWANEDDTVPFEYRELDDGTIEIISYIGHRRYITVPDAIDGKPVTSIGPNAFEEQLKLRRVLLPASLKRICDYAFKDCANLVEMAIPASVETIGGQSFYGDSRLKTLTFADRSVLRTIGGGAFGQTAIREITIPASVSVLDGSAFFSCRQLYRIQVEKQNKYFCADDGILFNLSKSELVAYPAGKSENRYEVPDSVRKIGGVAFAASRIRAIDLNRVEEIGGSAFMGASLTSVSLPDSLYSCGEGAFQSCSSLQSVSFGAGLLHIPNLMFYECTLLKTVTIPDFILSIGGSAFAKTEALGTVDISDDSQLVYIGEGAFMGSGLQSIRIPSGVQMIESDTFRRCYCLSSVTFIGQSRLESIGDMAFLACGSLFSISLPESVTFIGEQAFFESGLTEVSIPAATAEIGYGAFACCWQLAGIRVEADNTVYCGVDGVLYTADGKYIHTHPAGREDSSYMVLDGTEEILPYAFYGSKKLTHIDLPESLKSIGQWSFALVTEIREIQIPDNVIEIQRFAFACDWSLEQIAFGTESRLSRIGAKTFAECGITSFIVPKNVSSIGQYAFVGCCNLNGVCFAENSKLTAVPAYLFSGCPNLTSVTFLQGSRLTSIQAHGFEGLYNLTLIEFGNAPLANIDNFAFRFCTNLQIFRIPESVSHIGRYAFYDCFNLGSLTVPAAVEYIGRYAFLGTTNCELYFESETLPSVLQDDWDRGLKAYYLGVAEVGTSGDFDFVLLRSGKVGISRYHGTETHLDLGNLGLGGEVSIIGGRAFENCPLESVMLPDTLTTIQAGAFSGTRLQDVSIPAGVSFIGKESFLNTPIRSLTFASGSCLTTIEQSAFAYTKNLSSVTIPKTVAQLGKYVFRASGISSVTFEQGNLLEEIPKEAFAYTNLTAVVIPDSVTEIGYGAFRETAELESVQLPEENELRIRENAFYHSGLTSLRIPAKVREIGPYALVGLRKLDAFEVDEANEAYKSVSGLLLSSNGRKLIAAPGGKGGTVAIPEGVEVIGFGAFENSSAESVRFPENCNILTIGCRAFFQAQNLKTVTIPASVISIDYYAFGDCIRLHSVLFEKGCNLTGVYEGAFYGCESLQNISVPGDIFEIAEYAFYGCGKLDHLPVENPDTLCGIYDYAMAYTGLTGELVIPNTVTDVGDGAFLGTHIRSLTIPTAQYEILVLGLGIVDECNELEAVDIPFFGQRYMDSEAGWFGYIFGAGTMPVDNVYLPSNANLDDHIPDSLKKVSVAYTENAPCKHLFFGFADQLTDVSIGYGLTQLDSTFSLSETLEHITLPESLTHIDNLALSGCPNLKSVSLPDSLSELAYAMFAGDESLDSVTIPSHITMLPEAVFSGCKSLTQIDIPDSVTTIGSSAFRECTLLQTIDLPEGLTSLEEDTFFRCTSLKEIRIPDGVTRLGSCLFADCSSLETVLIPDSVTSMGFSVFADCKVLTSVSLPAGLQEIPDGAFQGCSSLRVLEIPKSVKTFRRAAFSGCSSLRKIEIPEEMTELPEWVFAGCSYLTELELPEGIRNIENRACVDCTKMRIVTLPSTLESIDECAFEQCALVTIVNHSDLHFEFRSEEYGSIALAAKEIIEKDGTKRVRTALPGESEEEYVTVDGVFLFVKGGVYGDSAYTLISYLGDEETVLLPYDLFGEPYLMNAVSGIKHVVFPDGWTEVPDSAFYWDGGLEAVTIPEGVTRIGAWSFANCVSLKEVHLPSTVSEIGPIAFGGCTGLETVTLPDGLRVIGGSAFVDCPSLTSLSIPASLEELPDGLFAGCTNLHLSLDVNNPRYVLADGILYDPAQTKVIFADATVTGIRKLPETVTTIPDGAFSGCEKLTGIILPDGLSSIGSNAFSRSGLRSIVIPDGVTTLEEYAFMDCAELRTVALSNHMRSIGRYTFANCVSLEAILLPDGVESIGNGAFRNCRSLEHIDLPDSVSYLGPDAFAQCSSLTSFRVPAGVQGLSEAVFSGCVSLARIDLPDGLKTIEKDAFKQCDSLTEIILPDGLVSLNNAFSCKALEVLYIPDTVTYLPERPWSECPKLRSVHLPEGVTDISWWFYGCPELEEASLPEGITNMSWAFYRCWNLKSVVLPSTVTDITGCFCDCTSLTSAVIPDGLTMIGQNAFGGCASLKEIHLPDSVRVLENGAFNGCASLKKVTGGRQVTEMGDDCFRECGKLASIVLSDSLKSIGNLGFWFCSELRTVNLPDSLESIGESAFCGDGLREVVVPEHLTNIGGGAFANNNIVLVTNHSGLSLEFGSTDNGCLAENAIRIVEKDGTIRYMNDSFEETTEGLVFDREGGQYRLRAYVGDSDTVTLPLTYRGEPYGMYYAYGFIHAILPEGMTECPSIGFSRCTTLQSVQFPSTLKKIGVQAFSECSGLTDVVLPDGLEVMEGGVFQLTAIRSIVIPPSVQELDSYLFDSCSFLESVELPDGIWSIGSHTFCGCTSLRNINLPESLLVIGEEAFAECESLTAIRLPDAVSEIGSRAFNNSGLYRDSANWVHGCLYVDGWLAALGREVKYPDWTDGMRGAVAGLVENNTVAKLSYHDSLRSGNVETVILTQKWINSVEFLTFIDEQLIEYDMQTGTLVRDEYVRHLPLSLKNIVISKNSRITNQEVFKNVTGVTIFVEAEEKDVRWDENYPGWSNGNRVYYGDQWNLVRFYDRDGGLVKMEPFSNSQVIRRAIYPIEANERMEYRVEWDLNGDGVPDLIPATTTIPLSARPIITQVEREYSILFVNEDRSLIEQQILHYGDVITAPAPGIRNGYDFYGYEGFLDGTTVTRDRVYTAVWQHTGGGHSYEIRHIEPGCDTEGYDEYVCSVCGESYRDHFTDALGHRFGDWISTKNATCTEEGEETRTCDRCRCKETRMVAVLGHDFLVTETKKATCQEKGSITYVCSRCGDTCKEYTETLPHQYKKTYANWDFITWLFNTVYHIFTGQDLFSPYYYKCEVCGNVMTKEEAFLAGIASAQGTCDHETAEWKDLYENCKDGGLHAYVCNECGKAIEAQVLPPREHAFGEWTVRTPADSAHEGERFRVCSVCGFEETETIPRTDSLIRFVDWDGTVLCETVYKYGDTVVPPADPARPADNTYRYTFTGWMPEVTVVTGDAVYTAVYEPVYIEYTVRFVDHDDRVISENTYHYGDPVVAPPNPTRPKDGQFTYTFAGWDQEITACYGNRTYRATYTTDENVYTVTFKNEDGTVIAVQTYHYNDTVVPPSDPVKAADRTYTYTFAGWTPALAKVTEDAVYTATYSPVYIDYTVQFTDYDGTVLSKKTYHYGDEVTVPSDPVRQADETYTYTFTGWTPNVVPVAGNAVYTALYKSVYIDYTVTFVDYDGKVLSENTYHYGDTVALPADPSRAADETYTYSFTGWDKPVTAVKGNETYTATYKSAFIDYTVQFVNYDGSMISENVYHYGDTVTVPEDPTRSADETYTYAFKGWDKEITTVTGHTVYTATYTATFIEYTVRFVDYDDRVISENKYHYGDTVTVPDSPTRESDGEYTYTFNGWDQEITLCYGDKTYRATYTTDENVYTVTFKNEDGTVILIRAYHYGDTVVLPADPVKAADETYTYTFAGWTPEVAIVTQDATYTATYTKAYVEYIIRFLNEDGTVLSRSTYHYGDTVSVPADPEKKADQEYTYVFAGWNPEVTAVKENADYIATYIKNAIGYAIAFWNYDGTVISVNSYSYGAVVTVPAAPSRPADEVYTYRFIGWSPEVKKVTGSQVYVAVFEPQYIEYTVTFKNEDGTVLSEQIYHYGDEVNVPGKPVKAKDGTYTYSFKDWDKEVTLVRGDVVYTAVYDKAFIDYTIVFKNEDGTVISEAKYHYGDTVTLPAEPTKPADEQYTYSFEIWVPNISSVTGNATYTAVYKATPKTEQTVEVSLDTANGGQNGETTILIPSDGKSTLSKISSTTAAPDYILGDITGDGDIDGRDYIVVKKYVLGTADLTDRQLEIADINGDGEVDGIDYLLIKKHVLGTYTIPEPQPVEVPGPDYAEFAVIVVGANGKVQTVKQADGKSKSNLTVPTVGYAIAIPKAVLDADEALKNAIAALKANDTVTLNGVSLNEQGVAVVLKNASIVFGNP